VHRWAISWVPHSRLTADPKRIVTLQTPLPQGGGVLLWAIGGYHTDYFTLGKLLAEDRPDEPIEAWEEARGNGPRWRARIDASLARMPQAGARPEALDLTVQGPNRP